MIRPHRIRALPCILVLALACGCQTVPQGGLHGAVTPEQAEHLVRLRIAVAPAQVAVGAAGANEDGTRYTAPLDPLVLRELLAQGLVKDGGFRHVFAITPREDQPSLESLLHESASLNADLLVTVVLSRQEYSYEGVTWLYLPSTLLQASTWAGQWWVPDEKFIGEAEAELAIYSVHNGASLFKVQVPARALGAFSEFGKGWSVWGTLFNFPGSMSTRNWERVRESLDTGLRADLRAGLVGAFRENLGATLAAPTGQEALTKRAALCLGISSYADPRVPNVDNAVRDANAFAAILTEHHQFLPDHVRVLADGAVTRGKLLEALAKLAEASREGDSTVVFLSCRGARGDLDGDGGPEAMLLPQDADPEHPDSALSVAQVLEALKAVQGKRVVLILDASFCGDGEVRSLSWAAPGQGEPSVPGGDGRVIVLLAAQGDQAAAEKPGKGHGLFSHYLLEGLKGDADRDADGVISWQELEAHLDRTVFAQSNIAGRVQKPLLLPSTKDLPAGESWLGR